jgi:CHAT domain-containing protein
MRNKTIYLLAVFFCFGLLPYAEKQEPPFAYRDYYREAIRIFNNHETTEAEDRRALSLFEKAIGILTTTQKDDSLLFESYVKGATLLIGMDGIQKSITWFNAAIRTGQLLKKKETAFFEPHLYCGRSWYALGQYDSALYHYKIAEQTADNYPQQMFERERLFNMLGALYYDLGNYKQAVNYFEKALQVLSKGNPDYSDLWVRYQNNIAGCLVRLNDYDRANAICDEVLRQIHNQQNPMEKIIWHRKANINLNLGAADDALEFLKKVGGYADSKQTTLLNDFANVYYNLRQFDSAKAYLRQSQTLNKRYYPSGKNPDLAVTFKIWGNVLESEQDLPGALNMYHRSVLALSNRFSDSVIYNNPESYSGIFAANTLLESLMAKAAAFEKWYSLNNKLQHLEAAVNTYQSVFELTSYMQKSYDTDEARLLLNKRKYGIHDNPIRLCVQLYRLTGKKSFLEKAFYFDEQNKASVLNENLALVEAKKASGIPPALLAQEKNLKQKLTILLLKAAQPAEETALAALQNQVRDSEIELNKLYEKLSDYPAYKKLNENNVSIKPGQVQKNLDGQTMLLAYHRGELDITCFWFKKNKWDCFVSPLSDSLFDALERQVANCRSSGSGTSSEPAQHLYKKLIEPVETELDGISSLIIIPDDELHQLPFESLAKNDGRVLGLAYSFCYNYSCNLLFRQKKQPTPEKNTTLALAPFANDSTAAFNRLRYSGTEIAELGGKQLLNSKARFMEWLPRYRVVHLATHASANASNVAGSYIAFNARGSDSSAQYLYSNEIVNLDMDSVQLVYLSACETGYGKLVNGEGMISLSRAFAYAGCPDIITSLWQADDATTASITQKFYQYYYKGYPPYYALHQAKKEYLEDPSVDKRKKTPYYWAHLVFVGQQAPETGKDKKIWIPILSLFVLLFVILFNVPLKKKSKR